MGMTSPQTEEVEGSANSFSPLVDFEVYVIKVKIATKIIFLLFLC